MHSAILSCLTCDTAPTQSMQTAAMRIFFGEINARRFMEITNENVWSEPCDGWQGVTCEDLLVTAVFFHSEISGNFGIHYLPQCVEHITIVQSAQHYEVETRHLPRSAISIDLEQNQIFGTLDLQALPEDLEVLNVASNRIVGPIRLYKLPRGLQVLNLNRNSIKQKTVWLGDLPETLTYISMHNNRIGRKKELAYNISV